MLRLICLCLSALLLPIQGSGLANAQGVDFNTADGLKWRMIGPFRGGRTVGATGVSGHPGLFYIGVNNGGVWKTDDFGRTWNPIFDEQPTGSIGCLAVSLSDPNTVYVGSGEGIQRPDLSVGDGFYRSLDGGKTWTHLGLRDGQQISSIAVDPNDPKRLFVAVLGHPYGPNQERGVFRSTDRGDHFERVLFKDADTGAIQVTLDPTNPQTVYADLFASRQAPWENGETYGPNCGLYKSTDGGTTWNQLTNGLPSKGLGRIGFGIAPSNSLRIYAIVEAQTGGVFRSDDAGASWRKINGEPRVWGRGSDFAEIKVDPHNPDIVYSANTSTYRSQDGGATWRAIRGAPGGDDYHTVWIDPNDSNTILLASDQGAVVSVNGGRTWSSWYNQPTAQFYHVTADNQFPYSLYGGQQESGSVGISSRGNDGQITFREWHPVGAEEYGYVAPDPLNPNIVFGGKLTKFDRTTGQVQDVSPPGVGDGKYRFLRTAPLEFSPADPHTLLFAGNVVFKTTDGGLNWSVISPDLTREKPSGTGPFPAPERRGVVYSLGLHVQDANVIWAGTDDGLVKVTRDGGKSWSDVTPPGIDSWSKISQIDGGHFDTRTAYLAVNRIRLDDMRPHAYRTHDGGKTWQEIVAGLPNDEPLNVVREDPVKAGLLYAGSERAVYYSIDDGDHWRTLRLNMPATSIRDLIVHGSDLAVATHGRGFWILDDISCLREDTTETHLCKPADAIRVHPNNNTDTPLPPDEPAGKNPPEGAIFDYLLDKQARDVELEIMDSSHSLVRRFTNHDPAPGVNPESLDVPSYWLRPYHALADTPGFHRFVWDLKYPGLTPAGGFITMAATLGNTPVQQDGPWVLPGRAFIVRLIVDGKVYERSLRVEMDPRVHASQELLNRQFSMAMDCYRGVLDARKAIDSIAKADRSKLSAAQIQKLDELVGVTQRRRRRGPQPPNLNGVAARLLDLVGTVEEADMEPTTAVIEAIKAAKVELATLLKAVAEAVR